MINLENTALMVSSKNQITLNKDIRNILGVQSGDKVFFDYSEKIGEVVIKKLTHTHICPVCNGLGIFKNDPCPFCNDEKFFKIATTNEFIINKLFKLLLSKGEILLLSKDEMFDYKISCDSQEYQELCDILQIAILKNKMEELVIKQELINANEIPISEYFFASQYESRAIEYINEYQIDILKTKILSAKVFDINNYKKYTAYFFEKYKEPIEKILDEFSKENIN